MNAVITTSSMGSKEYKSHALISYVLLAIGLFTAIPILVGAVWAMITKKGALGTVYHSHLVNITRTFWWSLFWTVVGAILTLVIVGYAVLAIAWLWALYRVVNGLIKALADEPYPI